MRWGRGRAQRVGHLPPGVRAPPTRDRSHPNRPPLSSGGGGNGRRRCRCGIRT